MSEFGFDAVAEAQSVIADEDRVHLSIKMTGDLAIRLRVWLATFELIEVAWDESQIPFKERQYRMLAERFKEAIRNAGNGEDVFVSLSYRDISVIGTRLLYEGDDTPNFFELNEAFVRAGGRDNFRLSSAFDRRERQLI